MIINKGNLTAININTNLIYKTVRPIKKFLSIDITSEYYFIFSEALIQSYGIVKDKSLQPCAIKKP